MIEYLKNASKIILLPSIVLYIFGFICITAYLARFGIVSFDIFNARYAIAGLYPLLSLSIVLIVAWGMHKKLPLNNFFETASWSQRYSSLFGFASFIFVSSGVLQALLSIGKYSAPALESNLIFKHLPVSYDFIGQQIEFWHTGLIPMRN